MSAVHDHFNPIIPSPDVRPYEPWPAPLVPPLVPAPEFDWSKLFAQPNVDLKELTRLIAEFRECVEAAKKLDILMKQPDCVDPIKVQLQARVDSLEAALKTALMKRKAKKGRAEKLLATHANRKRPPARGKPAR